MNLRQTRVSEGLARNFAFPQSDGVNPEPRTMTRGRASNANTMSRRNSLIKATPSRGLRFERSRLTQRRGPGRCKGGKRACPKMHDLNYRRVTPYITNDWAFSARQPGTHFQNEPSVYCRV